MATKKKNKSEDVVIQWWDKYKTLIAIIAGILAIIAFIFQFVLIPLAEKKVLKSEIEFLEINQKLEEYYKSKIDSLDKIISQKEEELNRLKDRLAELHPSSPH